MSPLENQQQVISRVIKGNAETIHSFTSLSEPEKCLKTIPEERTRKRRAPIGDEPAPKRR
jgi:hypothetical protein